MPFRGFVESNTITLVFVDTLAMFWNITDENDATVVTRAIQPLLNLARDTGACVLLIHHFRKSDGSGGEYIRGSNALLGAVDQALRLYRANGGNKRFLEATGRYNDTPKELIIELKDQEYIAIGDSIAETKAQEKTRVEHELISTPGAIEALAEKAKVPCKKVYGYLKALVEEGKAQQHGKGVKRDPFMYSKVLPHSLSSDHDVIGEERERESEIQNPVTSADATKPDESGEQYHA